MNTLATGILTQDLTYTGTELRPHFLLTRMGLRGSAVGAFVGPCEVATENLVDWEDRLAGDHIRAARMVHFIGEFFGAGLREGVLAQRLFISILAEITSARVPAGTRLWREGDDIFAAPRAGGERRKLTVSIVTASPVSQLLHIGVNLDAAGAPVAAVGLTGLGWPEADVREQWIPEALRRFAAEWADIDWACAKVRPVI